jgi:predicted GNAT family acetyltransferase
MIDNTERHRFELSENGFIAFAEYRVRDGKYLLTHVEADPALRGTGTAGRLMTAIVERARAEKLTLEPRCSYALAWFKRHAGARNVLG